VVDMSNRKFLPAWILDFFDFFFDWSLFEQVSSSNFSSLLEYYTKKNQIWFFNLSLLAS